MEDKELANYMNAWVMLKAASSTGINFLTRKKAMKEAQEYLSVFQTASPDKSENAKIRAFAGELIEASLKSRSYGSTLFGMVPMREKDVAQKLAAEIRLVSHDYPANLGLQYDFDFLYQEMKDVFFELVPDAEKYWSVG